MYTLDDFQNGQVLIVDKPLEWTSFQVVNKIHWLIRKQYDIKKIKVGHAGTLDPLATGLLLICTGKKTKQIQELMGADKTYTGTICLGATTASYDLETEVIPHTNPYSVTEQQLKIASKQFLGHIQQKPPIFSAIKQKSKRLYEHARTGEKVNIPSREVIIKPVKKTLVVVASGAQAEPGIPPSAGAIILGGPTVLSKCCFAQVQQATLSLWDCNPGYSGNPIALCEAGIVLATLVQYAQDLQGQRVILVCR